MTKKLLERSLLHGTVIVDSDDECPCDVVLGVCFYLVERGRGDVERRRLVREDSQLRRFYQGEHRSRHSSVCIRDVCV